MLTKCSLRQYKKTIDCLNDSNQSHIADLLSEGGVFVRVHANLEGSVGNVDELEEEIISQFTRVLENHSFERVTQLLDLSQQRIIAARRGQSIVIYIHCTSHDGLLQLIDQLKSDRLKNIIERVFTKLLSTGDALKVTLTWSVEEFRKAASYLENADLLKGRSATPKMGKIVEEKSSDVSEVELQSESKSDKVFVQSIITSEAEKHNGSSRLIRGFTLLGKELFIVSELSSEVKVYDSIKLSFIRRLKLTNLIDPQDIGSCYRKNCLYIFDFKVTGQSKEILRVDPNENLIRKWSTGDDWGYGLSVTEESNVILTVCNKIKLNEYSSDGQCIREINLLSVEVLCYPFYAIKLTSGNFLVSYNGYNDLNGVCIVNSDGKVEKSFSGEQISFGQIIRPVYLTIDRKGSVIVVDQENSRVLLLNSDLEFKREILTKEKHGLQDPEMILLD